MWCEWDSGCWEGRVWYHSTLNYRRFLKYILVTIYEYSVHHVHVHVAVRTGLVHTKYNTAENVRDPGRGQTATPPVNAGTSTSKLQLHVDSFIMLSWSKNVLATYSHSCTRTGIRNRTCTCSYNSPHKTCQHIL